MEKQTRSHDLESIKQTFCSRASLGGKITNSAFKAAQELGLTSEDVIAVIQSLTSRQFYKSMTSYADHRVWQDVYHVQYEGSDLYLKFTVQPNGEFLLISCKEK